MQDPLCQWGLRSTWKRRSTRFFWQVYSIYNQPLIYRCVNYLQLWYSHHNNTGSAKSIKQEMGTNGSKGHLLVRVNLISNHWSCFLFKVPRLVASLGMFLRHETWDMRYDVLGSSFGGIQWHQGASTYTGFNPPCTEIWTNSITGGGGTFVTPGF